MYAKPKLDLNMPKLFLSIIIEWTTPASCNAFSKKKRTFTLSSAVLASDFRVDVMIVKWVV